MVAQSRTRLKPLSGGSSSNRMDLKKKKKKALLNIKKVILKLQTSKRVNSSEEYSNS